MRQCRSLRVAHVLQQRARGAQCQRQFIDAETAKIERAELIGQQPGGCGQFEMPGSARAQDTALTAQARKRLFRGPQPLQFCLQGLSAVQLRHAEATGSQLQPGEPKVRAATLESFRPGAVLP